MDKTGPLFSFYFSEVELIEDQLTGDQPREFYCLPPTIQSLSITSAQRWASAIQLEWGRRAVWCKRWRPAEPRLAQSVWGGVS